MTPPDAAPPGLLVRRLDPRARLPSRGSPGAAGLDLYAIEDATIYRREHRAIATGVAVALPQDSVGIIAARSGLALRNMVAVLGGIIDPDYRGELQVILANLSGTEHVTIRAGDRIAQLLIMQAPQLDVIEVATLDATERDASGFGSSGR